MEIKPKTWVELDKKSIINNITILKSRCLKSTKISVCLKANAYGHGMIEIGKIVSPYVDMFNVDSIEEALSLRSCFPKKDIYIMGYVLNDNLKHIVLNDFHMVAYDIKQLVLLDQVCLEYKKKTNIHLKIETGTNRQGILLDSLNKFLEECMKLKNINIIGICTHFANIEDTVNHEYAMKQYAVFQEAIDICKYHNISFKYIHAANSAATMLFPHIHNSLVRIGISLYGLWPSKETLVSLKENKNKIELHPVLSWKTKVGQIKLIKKGSFIGYGCTFKTRRESKIAIIPIGYFDGYDRKLSNSGYVLINNHRAPILGRICMNMFVVDITDIKNVKTEDEVVLLGQMGNEMIAAEFLGEQIGTINYEIVTRINPNIKRLIV